MKIDGKEIARAFPRKTKATPTDELAFVGIPTRKDFAAAEHVDEVRVSVTFTYDIEKAEAIAKKWEAAGFKVKVGGPAFGDRNSDIFIPGLYVGNGYTFTSRGCNNNCWFCSVWKSCHGQIKELEIKDGWKICDDNVLATSPEHFKGVIEMLKRQPHPAEWVGGIEAKILQPWHAELMKEAGSRRIYCAYDTPDDLEPLIEASKIFRAAGFTETSNTLMCYCLIGWKGDTFDAADLRLRQAVEAGFMPFAMLYRDEKGNTDEEWRRFQRTWAAPQIVGTKIREIRRQRKEANDGHQHQSNPAPEL